MTTPRLGAVPVLRSVWRQLTSMRLALVLLFLLALASLPGALLPQWNLDAGLTAQFLLDNPTWGPLLDRFGFLGVFGSPWYAAIYLALFTSLIGCLVPRTVDYARQLRAKPVATPRNLSRLPHFAAVTGGPAEQVASRVNSQLRGWRRVQRSEPGGVLTISAEKGYLREVGNLVFHFALLGLLAAVAVGKTFGFEGTVVVTEGSTFCSGTPTAYFTFRPGLAVDGTELSAFCVEVEGFSAQYGESGQATDFTATIRYADEGALSGNAAWQSLALKVNEPLRINGERVYLLGHGYAPIFDVRFPNGETRQGSQVFQPSDAALLSEGVVKFLDPPGYRGDDVRKHQLALQGLFAPTAAVAHGLLTSVHPAPSAPAVAIQAYRGDLGMEDGASQSIFGIDEGQLDTGALTTLSRANLFLGDSMTLDDATVITFSGYRQWVQLQTSYDPAQGFALGFAVALLGGLMVSLTIKRRRVWFRIRPAGDGTPGAGGADSNVEVGGLARTDQAGYGEEFWSLVSLAEGRDPGGDPELGRRWEGT